MEQEIRRWEAEGLKKIYVLAAALALVALAFAGASAMRLFSSAAQEENGRSAPPALTAASGAPGEARGNKALVVYYSYTGNTRALAELVRQRTGGDLFELQPATPYSADYDTVVRQGKQEVEDGYQPPLKAKVENLASYDVIFVGTPIWWYTIAPPVATFLAQPELAGKTIVPFCTHGGYGAGHSLDDIKKLAPGSKVMEELSLRGGGSYDAQEIAAWLKKAGVAR